MRLLLSVCILSAAACAGTSDPSISIAGSYDLKAVDGASLPAHTSSGYTVRGTLDLNSNGRYTIAQSDSAVTGVVTAITSKGTWRLDDNALSLVEEPAGFHLGIGYAGDSVRAEF